MLEPFADGGTGSSCSAATTSRRWCAEAAAGGLQVAVHAIGDAANRAALDAFAATRDAVAAGRPAAADRARPAAAPRRLARVRRARRDRLDAAVARAVRPRRRRRGLGRPGRDAYAWRSLATPARTLVFGSDAPIEPLRRWTGSTPPSTARSTTGRPWRPEQALTVAEAVAGFTAGAAYAVGRERWRGCLLPASRPTWWCSTTTRSAPARADRVDRRRRDDGRRPLGARRTAMVTDWASRPRVRRGGPDAGCSIVAIK